MISVKIIADSIAYATENRITTFELEYPRFIHSELMTHRVFSRNAASSRAIPVAKQIEQVRNNPAMPIHWGKNQAGMQAKEEASGWVLKFGRGLWRAGAYLASYVASGMNKLGFHKQIVNRILEPFVFMKVVVTATEFDNWFWLRCHEDAQPEIRELARQMWDEYSKRIPVVLEKGEWHLPYYEGGYRLKDGRNEHTLEQAIKISASCCAQVSFRALDDSVDKAERIYDRLVTSVPVHASPFEHQASPIMFTSIGDYAHEDVNEPLVPSTWQYGITHCDRNEEFWSGNFKGWIQHRQLIPSNVCNEYKGEW